MRLQSSLITFLAAAASVSATGAGPAPARPTITGAPNPNPGPPPPALNARQADPSPSPPPSPSLPPAPPPPPPPPSPSPPNPSPPNPPPPNPSPPNPPTPLPPTCRPSLTSLLASLPTPPTTASPDNTFPEWASSSAPIQLVLSSITNNALATTTLGPDTDITALCSAAARVVTAPANLADEYAKYLNDVQMWRYGVEGDAYELAKECGGEVGLGLELLMATEAAMCVSGLRASVKPWATAGGGNQDGNGGGDGDGDGENAGGKTMGVPGVGRVVVGVVMGIVGGLWVVGGL